MAAKLQTLPPGLKPGALAKTDAAWYVALSVSTMELGVRQGWFPAPRVLSPGRVGWLTSELDEWLASRPTSELLPPANTGHSNRRRT